MNHKTVVVILMTDHMRIIGQTLTLKALASLDLGGIVSRLSTGAMKSCNSSLKAGIMNLGAVCSNKIM